MEPVKQIEVRTLDYTGFEVPAGWYGFVPAAGVGIVRRALVSPESGMSALEALGNEDIESRSSDFGGRRLIRMDGGYLVLNFMKYRDRDYTTAERSRRYRERKKSHRVTVAPHRVVTTTSRDITQAEAELEAETYLKQPPTPNEVGFGVATECKLLGHEVRTVLEQVCIQEMKHGRDPTELRDTLIAAYGAYRMAKIEDKLKYTVQSAKFFGEGLWQDKRLWPWKEDVNGKSDGLSKYLETLGVSEGAKTTRSNARN